MYKILTLLSVEPEPVELRLDVSLIVFESVLYQLALEAHFLEYHFGTQYPKKVRKKKWKFVPSIISKVQRNMIISLTLGFLKDKLRPYCRLWSHFENFNTLWKEALQIVDSLKIYLHENSVKSTNQQIVSISQQQSRKWRSHRFW